MNEFLTVVIMHMFAVMSPGPDFALITRQSIRYGREIAIWTSAGIGTGILFHCSLAISGILILIASNDFFISLLKIICSSYLLYLGFVSLIKSSDFNETSFDTSKWTSAGSFITGLITNITNVKALLFFITLFSVILNTQDTWNLAIFGLYMAVATFVWFSLVSYIFTSDTLKKNFLSFFKIFEKFLGLALVIIAIRILVSLF